MENSKKYKVLMALDPTEPELRPTESSLVWFKKWANLKKAAVEAVFVKFGNPIHSISESGLLDYVKTLNLATDVGAKVLFEKSSSRRHAVETLVKYSEETGSELIVVTSHGRSGPGRLVFGSFAESLLSASIVPILFLNEGPDNRQQSNKILYPTDLSVSSKRALALFLEQMGGIQSEIILYHAVPPVGAIFDTGILGVPVYLPESYWLEQKKWTDRECDQFLELVTSKGFKASVIIDDGVLNTPAAIQKVANDENVDLIGMASFNSGLETAVLGSVAREVFRLRKWPVWVCGPETINKGEKNENQ